MKNAIRHRQLSRCSVGAPALFAATCASAGLLPPGSSKPTTGITSSDAPHLASVFLQAQNVPFSFAGASGLVTGNIVQSVVRSTVDNTLDFYWRISLDASSASGLSSLAIRDFVLPSGSPLWADYRTDGIGDIGSGGAKRSPGVGSQIHFEFNAIVPGQTTKALLLDTQATAYALDGSMQLLAADDSQSLSMPAFVPTPVPEPSTYVLLGLGLAALGLRRWRSGLRP